MSTKELVITLRVPLSGEMFEDAAAITAAADMISALRGALDREFGPNGHTLAVDTETKRAPRADADQPRKGERNGAETSEPYTTPAT